MNVIEFLFARYAEEEATAKAAISGQVDWKNGWGYEGRALTPHVGIIHEPVQAAHVVYWAPARVLADVEAKRRVVAAIEKHRDGEWGDDPIHERVLYALASAYSTHPDYSQRWKP